MKKKIIAVPVLMGSLLMLGACIPFGTPEPDGERVLNRDETGGSAISLNAHYKGVVQDKHIFTMQFKNEGKKPEKLLSESGSFVSIVVKDSESGKVIYDSDKGMMGITSLQKKTVEPNHTFIFEGGIKRGRVESGTYTVQLFLDKSEDERLDVTLENVQLD